MSVAICVDPYKAVSDPSAFHVNTQPEYVEACRRIDRALANDQQLLVTLHNPAMRSWFDQYLGREATTLSIVDPCDCLARALGLSISDLPQHIRENPETIVSAGLLTAADTCPLKHGQSGLGWVASVLLGGIWSEETLTSPTQLGAVVLDLLQRANNVPLSAATFVLQRARAHQWSTASPFSQTLRWLFNGNPIRRAECLTLYYLVKAYPHHIRAEALKHGGRWAELSEITNIDDWVDHMPAGAADCIQVPPGYAHEVQSYLRRQLESVPFAEAVRCVSGAIPDEEVVLRSHIQRHLREIDKSWVPVLDDMSAHFQRFKRHGEFAEYLRRVRPVSSPQCVELHWRWDEVADWLKASYFPFYSWCVAVGRIPDTASSVNSFEQWLLHNYDEITRSDGFAPFALREAISTFNGSVPVLVLVVDALSWPCADQLRVMLAEEGISNIDAQMQVSALPAVTFVAKPCLIRGQLPGQLEDKDQGTQYYARLFAEALGVSPTQVACAASNDSGLQDVIRERKTAYLYLYNELDYEIHRALSPDERRRRIRLVLRSLAVDVVDTCKRFSALHREELALLIVSDHGFTELPESADTDVVSVQGIEGNASHGRVFCSADATLANDPNLVPLDTTVASGQSSRFFVPRGYACVGKRPRGATHGGLTPQETIVPTLVVDPTEQLDYQDVEIGITGDVRRGNRRNAIQLTLSNPNAIAVCVQDIDIRLVSIASFKQQHIAAGGSSIIACELDASELRQRAVEITGRIAVEMRSARHTTLITLPVSTSGAAEVDQAFEAEFDTEGNTA